MSESQFQPKSEDPHEPHIEAMSFTGGFGNGPTRTVVLTEGQQCQYDPINPRAMKNRGRRCELLEVGPTTTVRWLDTKRTSKVDPTALVPVGNVIGTEERDKNE